jgi:hypothetical protein
MGRYAFFNTGVEYKFRFAQQDSIDMTLFGGKTFESEDNSGDLIQKWTKDDIPIIKENLEDYGHYDLDLSKYENNINGTYKLKFDLCDTINDEYTYILGCIIYHQLHYTENLEVKFEI